MKDQWLDGLLNEVTNPNGSYFEKQAADVATKTVQKYLEKTYPQSTLEWVKDAEWEEKNVPLDSIKMGRRPGGARETDKVKAIAKAFDDGEKMEPVVLVKIPNGELKVADGYHRTLGCKHSGNTKIKAWVGKVDVSEGAWDKEMHEQKLNKGMPKAANAVTSLLKKPPHVKNPAAAVAMKENRFLTDGGTKEVKAPIKTPVFSAKPMAKLAGEMEKEAFAPIVAGVGRLGAGLVKNTAKSAVNFGKGISFAGTKKAQQNLVSAKANPLSSKETIKGAKKDLRGLRMNQAKAYGGVGIGGTGIAMNEYAKKINEENQQNQIPPISQPKAF